ncbi:MAG: type II toxin-antitoxin system RelE/ParE family toxin [Bacteroidia bacterium]
MAKRTVVWTFTAAKQRREILKYWTKRNKSTVYAEKLIKLTARQIKSILKHPESYKSVGYSDMRVSAMGYFSIYYKTTDEHLIITAFWDNRQDPKKVLELITS